jgi:hypothetical protein
MTSDLERPQQGAAFSTYGPAKLTSLLDQYPHAFTTQIWTRDDKVMLGIDVFARCFEEIHVETSEYGGSSQINLRLSETARVSRFQSGVR